MRPLIDESTGIEMIYQGKDLSSVPFVKTDEVNRYNQFCDLFDCETIPYLDSSKDLSTEDWMIPDHYLNLDIEKYLFELAMNEFISPKKTPEKEIIIARLEEELEMYKARNLLPVLKLMLYIVDTFKMTHTVWGVGRGSSVSSYCLYLLGVHKIDSIKYNLDIREFLK